MRIPGLNKVGALAFAMAIGGAPMVGCSKQGDGAVSTRELGAIGFKLSLPGGVSIETINYTITGPGAFSKTGNIPVGGSGTTFSAKIDGIPAGKGFTIKLDATESDGTTKCMGSASFDLQAGAVTSVSVRLQCPGKKGGGPTGQTGSVNVNGSINICAVVESATATPGQGGKKFNLVGLGSDEDSGPSPVSYKWTATAGTLSGTSAASATLDCPAAGGNVDIVFEVSDGDCGDKLALASVQCGNGGACGAPATAGCPAAGTTGGAGVGGAGIGAAGAGLAGAGGAGIGAAGTSGTGTSGTGASGTGASGKGASGTGTAGVGGTPGGSNACSMCESMAHADPSGAGPDNTNCPDSKALCDGLQGNTSATSPVMPNTPKAQLCRMIVDCIHTSHCGAPNSFNMPTPSDCLCGKDVDPNECFNNKTFAQATGACKDLIAAGAESNTIADLATRFFDPTYAAGAAETVIETCDNFFCMQCL